MGEVVPRFGINRSPLMRIVVFLTLGRDLHLLLTGLCTMLRLPVRAQSLSPNSSRIGEDVGLAMLDFGDGASFEVRVFGACVGACDGPGLEETLRSANAAERDPP